MEELVDPGGTGTSEILTHDRANGPSPAPFYQCIKTSLKSVVRDESVISALRDAALRANGIMTHTLQLLKLYLIYCYDTGAPLPTIDRQFVTSVMKVLCAEPTVGRPPSEATKRIKDTLKAFYEEHYKPSVVGELNYRHLTTVLDYLAIDVITMYETNIKQHFVEYVERLVNVSWEKKALVAIIKKHKTTTARRQAATNALCAQLRLIKTDLLSPDAQKTAHPMYHAWIDAQRLKVLPRRPLRKKSMHYDIQCSPQDYLPQMLYMMKAVEARGASVNNVCPLRSAIIPKHFRLDTTSLIHLCLTSEHGTRAEYLTKGNIVRRQAEIWGLFFKTEKKCFHTADDAAIGHAHTFDHQIETDGVSCSILLKRGDVVGKRTKEPKAPTHKEGGSERYIDEVNDYAPLTNKRVVAIDPNMSDLLYCVDSDTKDQTKFRYTQDQRRKETKAKKYRDYLQERKQETVDGKRVEEWEAELSAFNRKTTDLAKFKAYIQKKNELNARLALFYNAYIFRKLKLGSYMRRQITEARLLSRFKKLFGEPEKTIIAIGDFEQRKHRKFKEPIKGKGFRTLFRKAGYGVYLVDEFRTSCRCSACGGECKTFRVCENPRPYRTGSILRHGLVKCNTCSKLWNRDTNAASNIWKIAVRAIRGDARPDYLRRDRSASSALSGAL
jgi:transposase